MSTILLPLFKYLPIAQDLLKLHCSGMMGEIGMNVRERLVDLFRAIYKQNVSWGKNGYPPMQPQFLLSPASA